MISIPQLTQNCICVKLSLYCLLASLLIYGIPLTSAFQWSSLLIMLHGFFRLCQSSSHRFLSDCNQYNLHVTDFAKTKILIFSSLIALNLQNVLLSFLLVFSFTYGCVRYIVLCLCTSYSIESITKILYWFLKTSRLLVEVLHIRFEHNVNITSK